jgi:hypothetical protein
LVFPEGGTTNGTALLKFKQGAFVSEKRCRPMILKYQLDGSVHAAYDIIELLVLAILQMSWSCATVKLLTLPEFEPTEYLFTIHAAQGSQRWEIYAWALREAMMKFGDLKSCNIALRDKLKYEGYM